MQLKNKLTDMLSSIDMNGVARFNPVRIDEMSFSVTSKSTVVWCDGLRAAPEAWDPGFAGRPWAGREPSVPSATAPDLRRLMKVSK